MPDLIEYISLNLGTTDSSPEKGRVNGHISSSRSNRTSSHHERWKPAKGEDAKGVISSTYRRAIVRSPSFDLIIANGTRMPDSGL